MPRSADRPVWGVIRKTRPRTSQGQPRERSALTFTDNVQAIRIHHTEYNPYTGEDITSDEVDFQTIKEAPKGKIVVDYLATDQGLNQAGMRFVPDSEKALRASIINSGKKYNPRREYKGKYNDSS